MHMHTNWAWTWSSLWPAATEICLFNHQIKFMASFFHHPSTFKRRNTIPPSFQWGPGLFSLSLLLLAVLRGPQQLSLSLCTLTCLALSPSLHLFSSPLISSRPPLFKASAQALSQVLEGRNLAWFSDQSVGFVVVTACSGAPGSVRRSPVRLMSTHGHACYLLRRKDL